MSFILDALKRAESERQRGQVPGLQAQPLAAGGSRAADPGSRLGWWLGGTALALAALVAAVLWLRGPGTPPLSSPTPVAAATAPSAVLATTPSAAPATAPAAASSTESPTPAAPPPAVSGPVVRAGTAPAATTMAGVAAAPGFATTGGATAVAPRVAPGLAPQGAGSPSVPGTGSSTVAPAAAPAPGARPAAPAATAAPDPATAVRLSDLPAELRAQLPALAVQAAMYSDQPSQRLLVVNGQALGQGVAIAPDLVIESIGLNSSVLVFRGQTRFRLPH